MVNQMIDPQKLLDEQAQALKALIKGLSDLVELPFYEKKMGEAIAAAVDIADTARIRRARLLRGK